MAIGGDILIKLAADVAELRQGFDQARREVKQTQSTIETMANALKGLFALNVAERVVGTLAAMAREVGDIGEKAEALQLTTDQFQGIANAAITGGLGVDGMTTAFNRLNKEISNAVEGNKESIEKFDSLGVKLIDTTGRLRSTSDVAGELAQKIGDLDEPNQRAGKSMEFFGRSGSAVLPVMAQLAAGADSLANKLQARGGIASQETIERLDKFFDSIASSKQVLTAQGGTIFANVLGEQKGDISEFSKQIEAVGDALKRISALPIVQKGLGFFISSALAPLSLVGAATVKTADAAEGFGDVWARVVANVNLVFKGFILATLVGINSVASGTAAVAEAFANIWISSLNRLVSAIASQLPDWAKNMFGINGAVTIIDPIKIDFKPIGVETLLDATVAVQGAKDDLERLKVLQGQAAADAAEKQARIGKLPQINAPGGRNPPPKATGGAKDKVAEMLDELARRQVGEEKALAALKAASVDTPLREIEKAVDLQKKIDDMIAKVASKETGGASPELVAKITAQVTATENAAAKTKDYHEALKLAQDTEKQFGDGSVELADTMSKLNDAYATGRLGVDAYNIAQKTAKETADAQALAMRGQLGGVDALAAGFEAAAARYAQANNEFALGGQIFDGTIDIMSQGLDQFVTTGEIQFDRLLASFVSMLAQMALKAAASQVFGALLGGAGGGLGGGGGGLLGGLFSSLFGNAGSGERFAMGSTNDLVPGIAYTVGEFGPESFVPRVPGQILTADDMAAAWSGSAGPRVSQTINISTGVQQTVRAEIASMLPQIAQAGAAAAKRERERGGAFKQSFR